MASIDVGGKSYETDEEGYLVNLSEWNPEVADYIAGTESIQMTDQHWEVVNFLR
ncbi:MAG: TusE/DsrC/DsvC family sulfur relay protein, partial [Gallionella sp.]|nr:TusE/DsrC/DsvC family sulfur relay protein [Gallionella sp.]